MTQVKKYAGLISTGVLCKQPGRYIGWPTIARAANGDLLAVFSGDRNWHVCMEGKTQAVRSVDGGATWGEPATINDTPFDDRDTGLVALPDGTLVLSWFNSFHHPDDPAKASWPEREKWRAQLARISESDKVKWLGEPVPGNPYQFFSGYWTRRSTDQGHTWEEPVRSQGSAPHGPVVLSDGSLLYLGFNAHHNPDPDIVVQKSRDGGRSWSVETSWKCFVREKVRLAEPHAVEVSPGRVVGMFRAEGDPAQGGGFLWQAESPDVGATWNSPRPTEIWGKPPHLVKLRDGRLLLSYARRKEPFGQRACLSDDGGRTWDYENEVVLSSPPGADLGYQASLELEDGVVITVYYERDRPEEKPCLKAATWRLP